MITLLLYYCGGAGVPCALCPAPSYPTYPHVPRTFLLPCPHALCSAPTAKILALTVEAGNWKSPFADCSEAEVQVAGQKLDLSRLSLQTDGMSTTRVKHNDMYLGELL